MEKMKNNSSPPIPNQTGFEGEFESPDNEAMPRILIEGNAVILENGAELPVHLCINISVISTKKEKTANLISLLPRGKTTTTLVSSFTTLTVTAG